MTEVFYSPASWADEVPILIDLADHPSHVATSTDNGFQLRIPAYLWDRYQVYLQLPTSTPISDSDTSADADTPAPKKRGRPRKTPSTSPDEE
jgi:hypothetical protein